MAQRNLAGARLAATAHQAGVRDRVVRRSKRPLANERRARRQQAGDAVDLRHFQALAAGHARQDAGHRPRQQRLTRARRTAHQKVVTTGRRHFERPLDVLLSTNVGKVGAAPVDLFVGFGTDRLYRRDQLQVCQVLGELPQRLCRDDGHPFDQRRFLAVLRRHVDRPVAHLPGVAHHRQDAVGMA